MSNALLASLLLALTAQADESLAPKSETQPQVAAEVPPPADDGGTRAVLLEGSISDEDYPSQALASGEEGAVTAHYTVSATGTVVDCEVREPSASPVLDYATCVLIKERYRFTPARDKNGTPREESRRATIYWNLPDPVRESITPYRVTTRVLVEKSGKVADCKTEVEGKAPDDSDFCDALRDAGQAPTEFLENFPEGGSILIVTTQSSLADYDGDEEEDAAGQLTFHMRVVNEVAADGTITQCGASGDTGTPEQDEYCSNRMFEVLPQGETGRTIVNETRIKVFPNPSTEEKKD